MKGLFTTKQIAFCGLNTCLIAISAQIFVPTTPPATMQLAVIFFICGFFPFKISFTSITTYCLGGFIGLPFFSGFRGGVSILLGANGGFILSFMLMPLIYLIYNKDSLIGLILSAISSIAVCYLLGILWLSFYVSNFLASLKLILLLVPLDFIKATLAITMINSIKKRKHG